MKKLPLLKRIYNTFLNPSTKAVHLYRFAAFLHSKKRLRYLRQGPWLALVNRYNCFISPKAFIGKNIYFPHPSGIVIGDNVRIGDNCTIYQQVTLGAARRGEGSKALYPKVGNDVVIYAGAKIIGPISIGDGAVIGANAVVLSDVPVGALAVGVPAKIIKMPDPLSVSTQTLISLN